MGASSLLDAAADLIAAVPLPVLATGTSVAVTSLYKGVYGNAWLLNYWVALLAAFGGGAATALLVMVRDRAARCLRERVWSRSALVQQRHRQGEEARVLRNDGGRRRRSARQQHPSHVPPRTPPPPPSRCLPATCGGGPGH